MPEMADPRKPLSETIDADIRLVSPDVALTMMQDLARRIKAGTATVTAVSERTGKRELGKTLEVTYIESGGTKQ